MRDDSLCATTNWSGVHSSVPTVAAVIPVVIPLASIPVMAIPIMTMMPVTMIPVHATTRVRDRL